MLSPKLSSREPIQLALKRLTEFFRVLSNPRRISIIEELRVGEKDVSSLASNLRLQQSAISKHLGLLRAHKLVVDRKEGKKVFYRLNDPEITLWLVDGLKFTSPRLEDTDDQLLAMELAKSTWNKSSQENESK